jgi:transcription antitermination factor NusG
MKNVSPLPNATWHVVYTRPEQEKKVAQALEENNIPTYIPAKTVAAPWWSLRTKQEVPLFSAMVFVKIAEEQKDVLKKVPGVVNFAYWLGQPVTVPEEDVNLLKGFLFNHCNISVDKTEVGVNYFVNQTITSTGKVIDKVVLPCLGFKLQGEELNSAKVRFIHSATNNSSETEYSQAG